jgi:hypothetical protein
MIESKTHAVCDLEAVKKLLDKDEIQDEPLEYMYQAKAIIQQLVTELEEARKDSEKLKKAVECLKWYSDERVWNPTWGDMVTTYQNIVKGEGVADAGKKAQECLKALGEE